MKYSKSREKVVAKILCDMQTAVLNKRRKKKRRLLPKEESHFIKVAGNTIGSQYFPTLQEWIDEAVKRKMWVGWNYDGSAWKIDYFHNIGAVYDVVEGNSWRGFLHHCQRLHGISKHPNRTQLCLGIMQAFLRNKISLLWWLQKKLKEQEACKSF
jgi:hypothetical protein